MLVKILVMNVASDLLKELCNRKSKKIIDDEERKLKKQERAALLLEEEKINFALEELHLKMAKNKTKTEKSTGINIEEGFVKAEAAKTAEKRTARNRTKNGKRLAKEAARERETIEAAKAAKRVQCDTAGSLLWDHHGNLNRAKFVGNSPLHGCSLPSNDEEPAVSPETSPGDELSKNPEKNKKRASFVGTLGKIEEEEILSGGEKRDSCDGDEVAGSPFSVAVDCLDFPPALDLDGTLSSSEGGAEEGGGQEVGGEKDGEEHEDEFEEEEEEEEDHEEKEAKSTASRWKAKRVSKKQQKKLDRMERKNRVGDKKKTKSVVPTEIEGGASMTKSGVDSSANCEDERLTKAQAKKLAKAQAKARYEAFEARALVDLEAKEPGLRRKIYRDQAAALWQRSPENPDNPMHALFLAHEASSTESRTHV